MTSGREFHLSALSFYSSNGVHEVPPAGLSRGLGEGTCMEAEQGGARGRAFRAAALTALTSRPSSRLAGHTPRLLPHPAESVFSCSEVFHSRNDLEPRGHPQGCTWHCEALVESGCCCSPVSPHPGGGASTSVGPIWLLSRPLGHPSD